MGSQTAVIKNCRHTNTQHIPAPGGNAYGIFPSLAPEKVGSPPKARVNNILATPPRATLTLQNLQTNHGRHVLALPVIFVTTPFYGRPILRKKPLLSSSSETLPSRSTNLAKRNSEKELWARPLPNPPPTPPQKKKSKLKEFSILRNIEKNTCLPFFLKKKPTATKKKHNDPIRLYY